MVGAGLGSTGLAGVLAGGLQVTRRSRIRKSIEASYSVLANLDEGSPSHTALKAAIAADGTRLAALTLIGFPKSTVGFFRFAWLYVVVMIGVVFVVVAAVGPSSALPPKPISPVAIVEWTLAGVAFLVAVTFGMSTMLRERRDRFVNLTARGVSPQEAVRRVGSLGPVAQLEVYVISAATGRPPGILPIPWARSLTNIPRTTRMLQLRATKRRRERASRP